MTAQTKTGGREATKAVVPGLFALSVGRSNMPAPAGFEWKSLASLARLESGHTPSRARPDYWGGSIPWIGIRDATQNHGLTLADTQQHVTHLGLDNSSARLLPAGTVCLSRTASVGYVVIMGTEMATSQDFVNWVCGEDLSPSYLRYLLMTEQQSVRKFAFGSVHQTLYYPDAKALQVCVPPRLTQDAIASVLGALDDKIAANAKIARTADSLATALFAQVSAGLSKSLPYEEFATIGGGGTPSTKRPEFWGGDVHWATPTDVTALSAPYLGGTARRLTSEGLENCASPLYPAGSILMTSRATIGAFALATLPVAVNQGFIVANAKHTAHNMWLFHEMRSRISDYLGMANGATFLELSRGRFKSMLMRVHTLDAMTAFGEQVRPLHAVSRHTMSENQTLLKLRDTLLPALLSGHLRVGDAGRLVEDAV